MNIGRTIRVFRAEPVVSPVPEAETTPVADRAPDVEPQRPAEVEAEVVGPAR